MSGTFLWMTTESAFGGIALTSYAALITESGDPRYFLPFLIHSSGLNTPGMSTSMLLVQTVNFAAVVGHSQFQT
jgi:hypothetical protein